MGVPGTLSQEAFLLCQAARPALPGGSGLWGPATLPCAWGAYGVTSTERPSLSLPGGEEKILEADPEKQPENL